MEIRNHGVYNVEYLKFEFILAPVYMEVGGPR